METVYFTLVAIALYVFADWLLQRVEAHLGRTLENRSLIFFGILLSAALLTFTLIRQFAP
ncbi:MAG: hypothetical protein QF609_04180 [Gammaproteobacteria bacterium]|jgi:hypothetical protein|nr:hypothetical protein [Gammaproteobacteria bacterium]